MNRRQRRAAAVATHLCHLCQHRPGLGGTDDCWPCIEEIRENHCCPDCDSTVTTVVAEGVTGIWLDLAHDATCPTWAKKKAAS